MFSFYSSTYQSDEFNEFYKRLMEFSLQFHSDLPQNNHNQRKSIMFYFFQFDNKFTSTEESEIFFILIFLTFSYI